MAPELDQPGTRSTGSNPRPVVLRCGNIEVRPHTRECLRDGEPVNLERRAFDVLEYLMRHSERVVDKDELWQQIWSGRMISESVMPQAVSKARKALGGQDPEAFIATVYGVGYRFAQAVQIEAAETEDVGHSLTAPSSRWRLIAIAALLAAMVTAALVWWLMPNATQASRVAILPVQNSTGDVQLEWVSYGVLPLIDQALADEGVSRVSSGTVLATLRRYPDQTDLTEQARILRLSTGANQVLLPVLTRDAGNFHLTLSAIDDTQPYSLDLQGQDVAMLAVSAGSQLSRSLATPANSHQPGRKLVTDDAFVNEAFARGLDARLRGQFEAAAKYFDTVLVAAPDLHWAKYQLTLATRRLGDWDYTEKLNGELIQAARDAQDSELLGSVQTTSGILAWRRGDLIEAAQWYEKARRNFASIDSGDSLASVQSNLAILAGTRAEYDTAQELFTRSLAYYQSIGDRYAEATTLKNLGTLFMERAKYDLAEEYLKQSLEIRQQLRLKRETSLTLSVLADIEMARGHWAEADAYQQQVLDTAREFSDPVMETQALSDLSASKRMLGQLTLARDLAIEAVAIARGLENPTGEAIAILQHGRAEHALAHHQRAAELFEDCAQIYRQIEEPLGQAVCLISQGEALLKLDHAEQASRIVERARTVVLPLENSALLAEVVALEAEQMANQGQIEQAIAKYEQAWEQVKESDSPQLRLDVGGRLGLLLLRNAAPAHRIDSLAGELTVDAQSSALALEFLSLHFQSGDPGRALQFARQRKALLGEGWSPADQQRLDQLANSVTP